jgi:catechol 2,3-dioxygenase-like lactoylglutathione lyase family enzyme
MPLTLALAVRDLDATEVFYRDLLRRDVERFTPLGFAPVLLLRDGDATIVFRSLPATQALHPGVFQDLDRQPFGVGVRLEFVVKDLTAINQQFVRRQWPILYELEDAEYNRRELWVRDPDGYLVVLETS